MKKVIVLLLVLFSVISFAQDKKVLTDKQIAFINKMIDSTGTVYYVENNTKSIQTAITTVYNKGGGLVIIYPGVYSQKITMYNKVNLFCYPGVKITNSIAGYTVFWGATAYNAGIYGNGVFESTATSGYCIYAQPSSSPPYSGINIYIEADTVIHRGIPSNRNPNNFTTNAVYIYCWYANVTVKVKYIGSLYNAGLYISAAYGNNNIKVGTIETGIEGNYNSGSTASIVSAYQGKSFVTIDSVKVHNIGHVISLRGGYFDVHIEYATTINNRTNYATTISPIAIDQGTGDQWGKIYMGNLTYFLPDTLYPEVNYVNQYGQRMSGQAALLQPGQYADGKSIEVTGKSWRSEFPPDSTMITGELITYGNINYPTKNFNVSIKLDSVFSQSHLPIFMGDVDSLGLNLEVKYFYNNTRYDDAGSAAIWCLTTYPTINIKNTTFVNAKNVGLGESLYFYNRLGGKVTLDNVRFNSDRLVPSTGNTIRFYPVVPDTIASEIYAYNNVTSNLPFDSGIRWRGDSSCVRSMGRMVNSLSINKGLNVGGWINGNLDISSNDAYHILLPGVVAITIGLEITFRAVTGNTGGATLQVNSLTAKALTKSTTGGVATALATGDILAGQIVKAVYDGTQFQIISKLAQ